MYFYRNEGIYASSNFYLPFPFEQDVLELAQKQLSLLPQLREAGPEKKDALVDQEDHWIAVVQDATAVVQIKEAQFQLVTDYCRHRKSAKMMMDQLTAELDAMKM